MKTIAIPTPADWKALQHHPLSALAEFGAGIDLDALAAHMRTNGYDESEPIILLGGQILDGRHKHQAAKAAGVVPTFREFTGADPVAYVTKKILRQHLDAGQRALFAAALAKMPHGGDRKSEEIKRQICRLIPTQTEAAEMLNVSERAVRSAKKVIQEGKAELQEAVRGGALSVSAGARVAALPQEQQQEVVQKVRAGKKVTEALEEAKEREPGDEVKADEPVPVDGWGIPITPEAAPAFAARPEFDALLEALGHVRELYAALASKAGGAYLTFRGVGISAEGSWRHAGLEACLRDVANCRPTYTVCPYAFNTSYYPHTAQCSLCHGLNWVRWLGETRVPADRIDAAKKHYGVK